MIYKKRWESACSLLVAFSLLIGGCVSPAKKESPRAPYRVSSKDLSFDKGKVISDIKKILADRSYPSGLLASFTDTACFAFDSGKFYECFYGKMGYLDEQAFTYDLALGAMGLLLTGNRSQSEQILSALEKEFSLPKNGTFGLYNSYLVTSRIPLQDMELGTDGDRIHAGPMLWVAIAAINHMKLTRNTRYLPFALDIVNWCRTNLTYYRFPDGERGAVSMGMGWGPDWSKIFSTEHNVDYYSVLKMLRAVYAESSKDVRDVFFQKHFDLQWFDEEMEGVGRWIREVAFDRENYCFVAGVNEFGIDNLRILDGTSWGIAGVGPENYEKWGIDLDRLVESTEKHFEASYVLPDGRGIKGFDFTDYDGYEGARSPLVWFEGTGQLIIAYAELAEYYEKTARPELQKKYAEKARFYTTQMQEFSYALGLQGGLPYMSIRPQEKQIVKTLKWEWEIPRGRSKDTWVKSLSSTMWFLYCLQDYFNTLEWEAN